jgi:AraC-like DNA-binding protein
MPLHQVTRPPQPDTEVIMCVASRIEAARVQSALPPNAIVRSARTCTDLERMLRAAGDRLRMVIVAPRDDVNAPTARVVRDFTCRRPGVPLVGYCQPSNEQSRDIIELAAAGIHEIIFRDATDSGTVLRQTLSRASQTCGAAIAIQRLQDVVPDELRPLIEYCLYFPHLATSVPRVAAALGVHRKTLVNYTMRWGFPSPSVLIMWCRLVIAAHWLETRRSSVERLALALEFPSATAFRNTLRRYVGCRPAELRVGGTRRVIDVFAERLAGEAALHAATRRVG